MKCKSYSTFPSCGVLSGIWEAVVSLNCASTWCDAIQQVNWNELVPTPESVSNCICHFPKLNSNELWAFPTFQLFVASLRVREEKYRRCLFQFFFPQNFQFNAIQAADMKRAKSTHFIMWFAQERHAIFLIINSSIPFYARCLLRCCWSRATLVRFS